MSIVPGCGKRGGVDVSRDWGQRLMTAHDMMCRTYGAWGLQGLVPQPCRAGLAYAAPTALGMSRLGRVSTKELDGARAEGVPRAFGGVCQRLGWWFSLGLHPWRMALRCLM